MPRKRKRKRNSARSLWYLVQDNDILESSCNKGDLLSLSKSYIALNIDCTVVSKTEYEKAQKEANLKRRHELARRNEIRAKQDASLREALVMDQIETTDTEVKTATLPKESKRLEILESYKRLYPTRYTWQNS